MVQVSGCNGSIVLGHCDNSSVVTSVIKTRMSFLQTLFFSSHLTSSVSPSRCLGSSRCWIVCLPAGGAGKQTALQDIQSPYWREYDGLMKLRGGFGAVKIAHARVGDQEQRTRSWRCMMNDGRVLNRQGTLLRLRSGRTNANTSMGRERRYCRFSLAAHFARRERLHKKKHSPSYCDPGYFTALAVLRVQIGKTAWDVGIRNDVTIWLDLQQVFGSPNTSARA